MFDGLALDGLAREHSRKPEEAYDLIERVMPGRRYAEVFSRRSRPGWDCFGDEAGKFDARDAGGAEPRLASPARSSRDVPAAVPPRKGRAGR